MESTESAESVHIPAYGFNGRPRVVRTKQAHSASSNFPRTAKWCPDGSCALAQWENSSFTFLALPPEYTETPDSPTPSPEISPLLQPAPILDFAWYPYASGADPASFCFVASVRECPVKLLDANCGHLRASYPIVDHRERQIAPHSVAFNLTSEYLYCGCENSIERFSLLRPGEGVRLRTTPSRRSKDGLRGIVSALAFSPWHPMYAAGSFTPSSSNIALFDETAGETPIMFVGNPDGLRAGVTQLRFNPLQPYLLYASFRRQSAIYSWDLRGSTDAPVRAFDRALPALVCSPREGTSNEMPSSATVTTDQKLLFDVDMRGRWLSVGNRTGEISVFDLSDSDSQAERPSEQNAPTHKFLAHNDAIGSIGFNSRYPLLLSTSGSRHFDDSYELSSSDSEDGSPSEGIKIRMNTSPYAREASIKIWECRGMS